MRLVYYCPSNTRDFFFSKHWTLEQATSLWSLTSLGVLSHKTFITYKFHSREVGGGCISHSFWSPNYEHMDELTVNHWNDEPQCIMQPTLKGLVSVVSLWSGQLKNWDRYTKVTKQERQCMILKISKDHYWRFLWYSE